MRRSPLASEVQVVPVICPEPRATRGYCIVKIVLAPQPKSVHNHAIEAQVPYPEMGLQGTHEFHVLFTWHSTRSNTHDSNVLRSINKLSAKCLRILFVLHSVRPLSHILPNTISVSWMYINRIHSMQPPWWMEAQNSDNKPMAMLISLKDAGQCKQSGVVGAVSCDRSEWAQKVHLSDAWLSCLLLI